MIDQQVIEKAKEKGFEKYFTEKDDRKVIDWNQYFHYKRNVPKEAEDFLEFLEKVGILTRHTFHGTWQVIAHNIHFRNIDVLNPNSGRDHKTPKHHLVVYYFFTSFNQAVHYASHFKEYIVGRIFIQQVAKEIPLDWSPPECPWFKDRWMSQYGINMEGPIKYS